MEFKGTKGKWVSSKQQGKPNFCFQAQVFVNDKNLVVIESSSKEIEANSNAELIAEAGNIRQKIDCSLTELLEQRNELLEVLEGILDDFKYFISEVDEEPIRAGYILEAEKLINKILN